MTAHPEGNIESHLLFPIARFPILWILAEMILCAVHSPPLANITFSLTQDGTEIVYSLDMLCTMVVLTRIYLAFRFFARYSKWSILSGK
jgi:hypothetical protein